MVTGGGDGCGIASKLGGFLEGTLASLVSSHDCCCLVSSVCCGRDAAESTAFFGFDGAGAERATGARSGRSSAAGRASAAGEHNPFAHGEDGGHSFVTVVVAASHIGGD